MTHVAKLLTNQVLLLMPCKFRQLQHPQPHAETAETGHVWAVQAFEPKHGEHVVTKPKSPQLATRSRARPEVSINPLMHLPL